MSGGFAGDLGLDDPLVTGIKDSTNEIPQSELAIFKVNLCLVIQT